MKYEDEISGSGLGESQLVAPPPDAAHRIRAVSREDWLAYMSEPLRRSWQLLQLFRQDEEDMLLDCVTYDDWEEFCFNHSRARPASDFSDRLCSLDGLR